MARYKIVDRNPKFIPVVLDSQLIPGSFEYVLDFFVDNVFDLSRFDARHRSTRFCTGLWDQRISWYESDRRRNVAQGASLTS